MLKTKRATQATIGKMVRRTVRDFHPDLVILFGSHARGQTGPDSDVDLLVVMPVEGSRLEKVVEIRAALRDYHVPMDIVLTGPEEFAWRKSIVGTLEWSASREGKVMYARR